MFRHTESITDPGPDAWAGTGAVDRCRGRKSAHAENAAKAIKLDNRSAMGGAWLWNDKFRNIDPRSSEEVICTTTVTSLSTMSTSSSLARST